MKKPTNRNILVAVLAFIGILSIIAMVNSCGKKKDKKATETTEEVEQRKTDDESSTNTQTDESSSENTTQVSGDGQNGDNLLNNLLDDDVANKGKWTESKKINVTNDGFFETTEEATLYTRSYETKTQ